MVSSNCSAVTVVAPINIAIIKYWGKRNEELMLPWNDSISVSINDVFAETCIRMGPSIKDDNVSINGVHVDLEKESRFSKLIVEMKRYARKRKAVSGNGDSEEQKDRHFPNFELLLQITSKTNFPVAAGLASSAAGFAAIAVALGKLFDLPQSDIIRLARQGSGSACRSVLSGFVHWKAGFKEDGSDCICESIAPIDHWSSLRALVLVTQSGKKEIGSTVGMRRTANTSELYRLCQAIQNRDFEVFANIAMKESNQIHALCMDATPPIKYLDEHSWHLIRLVHSINEFIGKTKLAYSFDAGSNCTLFLEEDFIPKTLAFLKKYFCLPGEIIDQVLKSPAGMEIPELKKQLEDMSVQLELPNMPQIHNAIKNVFLSHVGAGPRILTP
ncbi:unnamed protein product [Enterobius vermicularis]|uniref:Diphosphomevalonate decarboxylase n=1 Tax=Enterobius vermicularis TaxID=51028 RepID=A0A0N4V091_ENTVE|nr:unnamed protein product [Enterobius vermicularis]